MGGFPKVLSGRTGGRIEGFYRGNEGQAMVFISKPATPAITPAAHRIAGLRTGMRMQPSRLWQGQGTRFWR